MLKASKINIYSLVYLHEYLKNNKDFFLKMLLNNGLALDFASDSLKEDILLQKNNEKYMKKKQYKYKEK